MVNVLLGAGFTRVVGGPLADDVTDQVYAVLAARGEENAARLVREMGFEGAFGALTPEDQMRPVIVDAIVQVFNALDERHRKLSPGHPPRSNLRPVIANMMLIPQAARQGGSVFTTNYDMLVERFYSYPDGRGGLDHAFLKDDVDWFRLMDQDRNPIANSNPRIMNLKADAPGSYVKLHGSIHLAKSGSDPVIGVTKREDISRSRLLAAYFEKFQSDLSTNGSRLLVYGYGFGDSHINDIIEKSARDHGLHLFVWDVGSRTAWERIMSEAGLTHSVAALRGYCGQSLSERFPAEVTGSGPQGPWKRFLQCCPDLAAFLGTDT